MTEYDQVYHNIFISSHFNALCSWKVPSILFTRVGDFLQSFFLSMTLVVIGLSWVACAGLSSSFFIIIFSQRYVAKCYNMPIPIASLSLYSDALQQNLLTLAHLRDHCIMSSSAVTWFECWRARLGSNYHTNTWHKNPSAFHKSSKSMRPRLIRQLCFETVFGSKRTGVATGCHIRMSKSPLHGK